MAQIRICRDAEREVAWGEGGVDRFQVCPGTNKLWRWCYERQQQILATWVFFYIDMPNT